MRVRVRVRGRVQGVWFRESTRRAAEGAGVRGWVCNRRDGSVEALLDGASAAVRSVVDFMGVGPEQARVAEVAVTDEPPGETPAGFEVH